MGPAWARADLLLNCWNLEVDGCGCHRLARHWDAVVQAGRVAMERQGDMIANISYRLAISCARASLVFKRRHDAVHTITTQVC